jgi:hypothetical protein
MTLSFASATLPELEDALFDLGSAMAYPPTPDISWPLPQPIHPSRPWIRSFRRSLLIAAAIALLVAGVALGIRFGLQLLSIDFGPVPSFSPTASASSGGLATTAPIGAELYLGTPVTLAQAKTSVPFRLLVPDDPGAPDIVYVGGAPLRAQVAFLYAARPTLSRSDLLGAGLLVTQAAGALDENLARKLVDSGVTHVEQVLVDGAPGYWFAGAPHAFWYLAPDGTTINESRRQVGNTLAWQRDGVLYRIEGAFDLPRALEIALSMR